MIGTQTATSSVSPAVGRGRLRYTFAGSEPRIRGWQVIGFVSWAEWMTEWILERVKPCHKRARRVSGGRVKARA